MKSLLEKVKEIKVQRRRVKLPDGFEDIALAWCRGEITLTQIAKACNLTGTGHQVYAKLAIALKDYLNENYKL